MRLFSIIQWHHFAYMIIGLALLGYGISGTIVSIAQHKLLAKYSQVYITCIVLFAISAVGCFTVAQSIPFNAEEILWDSRQAFYLATIFLLLTLPFFFAASAICLSFMHFGQHVSRIYALDLIGAGIGSIGIILLLFMTFPQSALATISITQLIAALIACWELKLNRRFWLAAVTSVFASILLITSVPSGLTLSPYKGLTQTLRVPGTQIIEQRSSPLGLLTIVESKDVPLRHAPGLSLTTTQEPLPQLGIFTDGDNMSVITQTAPKRNQLAYLNQMTSALAYNLTSINHALILGAGGGTDILQAYYHQVPTIDAVELNSQIVDLLRNQYQEFTGGLFRQANISIHNTEARGFLSRTKNNYDLIQLSLLDDFNASSSGLYALSESYLYTTEALQLYLSRLNSDGYLSITRWIKMPPRDTLKLFATAITALTQSGITQPGQHLVLIRGWQTSTLLVKTNPFNPAELQAIERFCHTRAFDIAYTPTIQSHQLNRVNLLPQPLFYQGAIALLGNERDTFLQQYKFNLQPASDDRPYFHHFFKWSSLSEIINLRDKGGMPLLEWGYMIIVATLVIAALMSSALILTPLWFYHHTWREANTKVKRSHILVYFFAIGLAFLFIEIAFIQKFILFLHHPIYAIAVTLTAFLVFAGLGSNWSMRLAQRYSSQRTLLWAITGISLSCLGYIILLDPLFTFFTTLSITIKIVITLLLIAPLAFCMGMPFPLALSSLAKNASEFIPWAWGINGCASVISAVLATLLAIHLGFTAVLLLAVLLYISIVFLFPAPITESTK